MSASVAALARFLRARGAVEGWSSPSSAPHAEGLRRAGLSVEERATAPAAREPRDFVLCAPASAEEARRWALGARHLFVLVAPNDHRWDPLSRSRLPRSDAGAGAMLAIAWSLGQVKEQVYLGDLPAPLASLAKSDRVARRLWPEVAWVVDVTPRSVSSRRRRALALADGASDGATPAGDEPRETR